MWYWEVVPLWTRIHPWSQDHPAGSTLQPADHLFIITLRNIIKPIWIDHPHPPLWVLQSWVWASPTWSRPSCLLWIWLDRSGRWTANRNILKYCNHYKQSIISSNVTNIHAIVVNQLWTWTLEMKLNKVEPSFHGNSSSQDKFLQNHSTLKGFLLALIWDFMFEFLIERDAAHKFCPWA